MSEDFSLERIRDRLMIEDVLSRWARGVDRLDGQAMRDAFHEDGIDDHGPYVGGIDGFVDYVMAHHVGVITRTAHLLSNILIEFTGPDTALVETHFWLPQLENVAAPSEGVRHFMATGRYIDQFERRAGTWKIAHRKLLSDWTYVLPRVDPPKASSAFAQGVRGPEDHLFKARRDAGLPD